jgi:hypothetical protein
MSVKYFNCRWQHRGENHTCIHVHVTALHVFFCFLLLSFVFLLFRTLYFNLIPVFFFRDASMAYILFIGYMRLSTHLVLRILSNPRIYIVVLLYKSLSNPKISIGLYRCYFFLSHELIITCVLSMCGCVYFYLVHTLNSVTTRSNTQLPEAEGLI